MGIQAVCGITTSCIREAAREVPGVLRGNTGDIERIGGVIERSKGK